MQSCKGAHVDDENGEDDAPAPYLKTDDDEEAVGALEMTAHLLEAAERDPQRMWKWAVIALHNAVQGFMVLNLRGTWNVGALHRDQRTEKLKAQQVFYKATAAGDEVAAAAANEKMLWGEAELASFVYLYARIKDPDGVMIQFMHSRVFKPRENDDRCMNCLNDIRNEFMHYVPHVMRRFLLTQFPAVTEVGLHVISFLLNESGNILWARGLDRRGLKSRADDALRRAQEALVRLQAAYTGYPLPRWPLCAAEPEEP